MIRLPFLLVCIGVTTSSWCAPLGFRSAMERAVSQAPELAALDTGIGAAQAETIAAGRLPEPRLLLGIDNLPVEGRDAWHLSRDEMTMRSVGLMQELPNRARRSAEVDRAVAAVEEMQAGRRQNVIAVRREAGLAWLERFHVERQFALLDEMVEQNALLGRTVAAALAGGAGSPADVLLPRREAAELADRRDELEAALRQATAKLRRWLGDEADGPLEGAAPALTVDAAALRSRLNEHPELAVFVPRVSAAQAEVRAAQAQRRPDWALQVNYGHRGNAYGDMVSAEVSLTLPMLARTRRDAEVAARLQSLHRLEAQRAAAYREHALMLESRLAEHEVLQRQLTRLREQHLPLAQQEVELTLAAYRGGTGALDRTLGARRALIDVRLRQIMLEGRLAAVAADVLLSFHGELP